VNGAKRIAERLVFNAKKAEQKIATWEKEQA
jgi:hypothetical protein